MECMCVGFVCVQPDVVDESSQVSLTVAADGFQAEVETLKQVCTIIVPSTYVLHL